MRKVASAAAITAIGTLALAGTATAVDSTQGLTAKFSPSKAGTSAKPAAVGLSVSTPNDNISPTQKPFGTTKAVITFDKNVKFNPTKFKTCALVQGNINEASCPSGSKVGTGSATAQGTGTDPATGGPTPVGGPESIKIAIFNGPKSALYLHLVGASPLAIDSTMIGKLSGRKLTVNIPNSLVQPVPGVFAEISSFTTKIKKLTAKKSGKSYAYAGLKGCTGGKLTTTGKFYYTDGTTQTAKTTASCSKK